LRTKKANYGARGGEINLRWSEGRFVREGGPVAFTFGKAGLAESDCELLEKIRKHLAQNRTLSDSPHAENFVPKVFAKGRKKTRVWDASVAALTETFDRLLDAAAIRVVIDGPKSRRVRSIVVC